LPTAIDFLIEDAEALAHLRNGSDGAQGVVFVNRWNPEHGHDRVADEFLNRSSMPLENALHFLEIPRHEVPKGFGIESLAKLRGANQIREHDGNRLAHFPLAGSSKSSPAGEAELRSTGVLFAALGAGSHPIYMLADRSSRGYFSDG